MKGIIVSLACLALAACFLCPSAAAFQQGSHQDIGRAAFLTLQADGKTAAAAVFDAVDTKGDPLSDDFIQAEWDADRLDLEANHYYDPYTGQGLAGFEDAATLCSHFYAWAVQDWSSNWETSIEMLGRAAHLLQDCSMPHHTHLEPLNGHAEFEAWLAANLTAYLVYSGGWYSAASDAEGLCRAAALIAYDNYSQAASGNATQYAQAASIIVPDAVQSTAALIDLFMDTVSAEAPSLTSMPTATANSIDLAWSPCTSGDFARYEIYASAVNKAVLEDGEIVGAKLGEATLREQNWASMERTGGVGTYEFVVVTTLHNGTQLRSNVLSIQDASPTSLIVAGVLGVTAIAAVALMARNPKGRRRKR